MIRKSKSSAVTPARKTAAKKGARSTAKVAVKNVPKTAARTASKSRRPVNTAAESRLRRSVKPRKRARAAAPDPRLRIRLYRHGLGDCLLLRFARDEGGTFNVLIDCGLISVAPAAKDTMTQVAEDIASACGEHIDVVVMTHEHWDHASGFSAHQAKAVFDRLKVSEAWYAWTEDPRNALGKRLRKERQVRVEALEAARRGMAAMTNSPLALERSKAVGNLLQFFGIDPNPLGVAEKGIGRTRAAFEYLAERRGVKTRYCHPAKPPMALPGVSGVRVYVFGPPEDESMIKRSTPTKAGKEVYELVSDSQVARGLGAAFERLAGEAVNINDLPFDRSVGHRAGAPLPPEAMELQTLIDETWNQPAEAWRKIEDDWTQAAETLALNLDNHTNNTCLVLAFEFVDTGQVFLFPGDAQVGNWLSWQSCQWRVPDEDGHLQTVSANDLLARTVFYKVGHHGSHNATLRELGLERMTSDELIAFLPVNVEQALKNRWTKMPFQPLLERLQERTDGRVLQADQAAPKRADLTRLNSEARKAFLDAMVETDLYFEITYD